MAACAHCGLPVQDRVSTPGKTGSDASSQKKVFCCFGCKMVYELHQQQDGQNEGPRDGRPSPYKLLVLRWLLAVMLSVFQVFISITMYFEGDAAPKALEWVNFALGTGVLALLASAFVPNLLRELRQLHLSLAGLIFTGTSAAYGLSVWSVFTGSGAAYFETSSMILTFYIGSLLLDAHFKQKLAQYGKAFEDDAEPEVLLRQEGGQVVRTPAGSIPAGSRIRTAEEEYIWFDGIVTEGQGLVDEAQLTGEPEPVAKRPGDRVRAGSFSLDGGLELQTEAAFAQSSLQVYLRNARQSRYQPGFYERMAHKGASLLLFFVMFTALSVLSYYATNADWDTALRNFLSVLLIGCPCAFSISTPAAVWIANQRLQDSGLLVLGGGQAIEKLTGIDRIIFDKTGTLTEGIGLQQLQLEQTTRETFAEDEPSHIEALMQLAGGLEAGQMHPVATAVRGWLALHHLKPAYVTEAELLPGLGLQGRHNGKYVLLANNRHPDASELEDGQFGLFVDGALKLRFRLYQPPKEHLARALDQLSEAGTNHIILSGDPAPPPEWLVPYAYKGGCTPEEKQRYVKKYQQKGEQVMFIGDGTNDMMASAAADIGVVMGNGTPKAKELADIILLHPDLSVIPATMRFAGRVKSIIRMNFFWALIYNVVGMSVAAMGLLHPFFAILAMMLSSIFVSLNSLRLRSQTPELLNLASRVNEEKETRRPGERETS
jgi:Cu2+-exporting ATPase/Cu+-exporting ATPase